ncbi:MAG: DUF169 domain-containing protein [Armatimonadota bacterium]|nr:DUF169 domain-containing protein [Armatimonadota bacterium]
MNEASEVSVLAERMMVSVGLSSCPVGVKFLRQQEPDSAGAVRLEGYRYCQAVMKARRGETVILDAHGISCPAAASAFGFRDLPEQLASGHGLVGFGIVEDPAVGKRMFEEMTRLQPSSVEALLLFPLNKTDIIPDVVVVEGEVEHLMWIALAGLQLMGGERVRSSTAVLQATCVDSTIIPFVENRLNLSFGCYGCREATDIASSEAVLGFPGRMLAGIVERLEYLAGKAVPNSRSKRAFARSLRRHADSAKSNVRDTDAGACDSQRL